MIWEGRKVVVVVVRHSRGWQAGVLPLLVVGAAKRPKDFTCQANWNAEFGADVLTEQLRSGQIVRLEGPSSSYVSYIARRGQEVISLCNECAVQSVETESSQKSGGQ